ncbi:MAG: type II toxin-antitoxin system RelE/ParE family toxin [Opitutaceae bacterium]
MSRGSNAPAASRFTTVRSKTTSPRVAKKNVSRPARTHGGERPFPLSSEIHVRVITAIKALANNPRPSGGLKLAGANNDWRIRVGDYRVIYEIADAIRVVRVNRVRHRREVYR